MLSLKTNLVARITSKSADIIDVFTKTVNDLTALNNQIDIERDNKLAERAKIEADLTTLAEHREKHDKVISKINKIFE